MTASPPLWVRLVCYGVLGVLALLVLLSVLSEFGREYVGWPHFCGGTFLSVECEVRLDLDPTTAPATD